MLEAVETVKKDILSSRPDESFHHLFEATAHSAAMFTSSLMISFPHQKTSMLSSANQKTKPAFKLFWKQLSRRKQQQLPLILSPALWEHTKEPL